MPAPPAVAWSILPLAANDWLEGLVPFLFFVIWIISQVMGVVRRLGGGEKVQGGGAPGGARPAGIPGGKIREVPPPVPPAGERGPRAAQEDLQRQIEAFRRAQAEGGVRDPGRRPAPKPPALPPAPRPRDTTVPRGQEGAVRRPSEPSVVRPAAPPPRPMAPVPPPILGGHAGEIGRHVEGAFAHDLAQNLKAAIGPSAGGEPSPVAVPSLPRAAEDLVAMFRDPATIRQVVLLREVLDRPIDRW